MESLHFLPRLTMSSVDFFFSRRMSSHLPTFIVVLHELGWTKGEILCAASAYAFSKLLDYSFDPETKVTRRCGSGADRLPHTRGMIQQTQHDDEKVDCCHMANAVPYIKTETLLCNQGLQAFFYSYKSQHKNTIT